LCATGIPPAKPSPHKRRQCDTYVWMFRHVAQPIMRHASSNLD
jgi:hypothetical protein